MLGVMDLTIPEGLARNCSSQPSRRDWLARLPALVAELQARWSLTLGAPYEAGAAWVAPVTNRPAVLKLGMPHMEADQEIAGMQFWDGEPTARLLDLDVDYNALLLEQCDPGTPLGELPEAEQDVIMAGLLRRLWRVPADPHPFRPLSLMTQHWSEEARQKRDNWVDAELLAEGLRLFEELPRTAPEQVLLATDLHAGNVLQAQRQPWLVIDPKPHRSRLHYGLRVLYLGLIVIPNTVLGASIVFNSNLLYQSYYDFPQPLGMDPLTDQQVGGLLLWVIGDMMSILASGVVMIMWYQREQEQEETWGATSD